MKKTACVFFWISILAMFCGGCVVAESKYLTKVNEADLLSKKVTALTEENASLKQQVESLTGQSNEQIKNIAGLQADIERLKESLSQAKKESQEVENKSKTYQELVKQMKSEIAQGQITNKELKGKLTMDVVDKILFASGEAKVKKEGLEVLNRVVEKGTRTMSRSQASWPKNIQPTGSSPQPVP
jgi:chemotaxis protein MotB